VNQLVARNDLFGPARVAATKALSASCNMDSTSAAMRARSALIGKGDPAHRVSAHRLDAHAQIGDTFENRLRV